MKRLATVLGGALVLAGAAAGAASGARWRLATRDAYVLRLEDRIAALLPAVERELGASIPGRVRVVVSTRDELGALGEREMREVLAAIEGPPTGDKPGDDVKWTTHGVLGCVDEDGVIHMCRQELEGAPHDDFVGAIWDRIAGTGKGRDAAAIDRVLVHELVHVFQTRALDSWAFLRSARDRADLLARMAVAEGHAEAVAFRVAGMPAFDAEESPERRAKWAQVLECYWSFELDVNVQRQLFPYVQGRKFVESAVARLGPDAVARLSHEPPSLMQVEHPETWPGPRAPEAGTDAALRRARAWLDAEWKETACDPPVLSAFLALLAPASRGTQDAAAAALWEVQRIEAKSHYALQSVRGHLLAARDEAGARTLEAAWLEAARARDALISSNPKLFDKRVLAIAWSDAAIDGLPARLAVRSYRDWHQHVLEHSIVVRRGRHVVELRLVESPGGTQAALRFARRLLACIDATSDPDASTWDARWRFAVDPRSSPDRIRPLLADEDADVRQAALLRLLRSAALSDAERDRARRDPDPLVRLTALTWIAEKQNPREEDVRAAVGDADPWVAAGGWDAVRAGFDEKFLPEGAIAEALRRPEAVVRRAASGTFDHWSDESEEEKLALVRTALADDDAGVRGHGAGAMLHIKAATSGLAETFVQMLTGVDAAVRDEAVTELSVRDAVPGIAAALVPFLDDEKNADDAVEALGKLGAEAASAVPKLRRIADDAARDGRMTRRRHALDAIAAITGDPSDKEAAAAGK